LGLVPQLGEEVKTQAVPDATCATTSLRGIALGYEGFHQPTELPLLVESILRELIQVNIVLENQAPHLISRCFPVSMTHVISGIVMPVSAIFVARIDYD
jgi:hypothetical protein